MSMSHLEIDAGFLDHPKFIHAERLAPSHAVHLWLGLMSYCKAHQTDGVVPCDALARVHGPTSRWRKRALEALLAAGLIERDEVGACLRVHDYLEWNWSRAAIDQRAASRKRRRETGSDCRVSVVRLSSERHSDRRVSDIPTVVRDVEQPSSERQPVSNDTASLDALGSRPGRGHGRDHGSRARERSGSGSGSEDLNPLYLPPSSKGDTGDTKTTSTSESRVRKNSKSKCPAELRPDPTTAAKAWELGFSETLRDAEIEACVDWAHSKNVTRADWQATLRNWLRRTAATRGLQPRKPRDASHDRWLAEKRAATEPPKEPVKLPPGALQKVAGGLFA